MIVGKVIDTQTGIPVEARVQIIASRGNFVHPQDAIIKSRPWIAILLQR